MAWWLIGTKHLRGRAAVDNNPESFALAAWAVRVGKLVGRAQKALPPGASSLYVRVGKADFDAFSELAQCTTTRNTVQAAQQALLLGIPIVVDSRLHTGHMEICYAVEVPKEDEPCGQ